MYSRQLGTSGTRSSPKSPPGVRTRATDRRAAAEIYLRLSKEKAGLEDILAQVNDPKMTYGMSPQNALKFALVRACGQPAIKGEDGKSVIDESTLVVTGDIARWACELSHITVQTMEASVRDEIADTDFGRLVRDLVHAVRKAGERGLTRRELARNRAGKHPKRVLEDILSHAIESGSIALRHIATAGRKRSAFVHADFFKNKDAGD